jgi:DnaK suppressor protein
MSPLSNEQLQTLRTRLEALVRDLADQIEDTREVAKPVDLDEPIGRVSRMDAIQQQSMAQANRGAARQRLNQARAALERLDEGEYGECASCGEDIALARLEAAPESAFCVDCQGRREKSR